MLEKEPQRDSFEVQIPQVETERRGRKRRNLKVLNGQLKDLPTVKDLKDPDKFLSFKKALVPEIWRRYYVVFSEVLPTIVVGSDIVILRLEYRGKKKKRLWYYVSTNQATSLQERFSQHRDFLEQKLREKRVERLNKLATKLSSEKLEELVERIRQQYREDQPIFYRADSSLRQFLGISHQTLNDILTIAQRKGVIPLPHRVGMSRKTFYSKEEIITTLKYLRESRQRGEGLVPTAKRLRAEAKVEVRG